MRSRWKMAALAAALASMPIATQAVAQDTGRSTETQERLARGVGDDNNFWYNLIGLLGLLGLRGLWRPSDNDGYTEDPV